jgi:aryl-alcohol dehydrogenase-like predicted oxidoreductase
LPAAKDLGIAVLVNRPYGGGNLFGKVRDKELPGWIKEFDINSWGQFFLKFILSNDAVTCVIPGTSKPKHALDNMLAGYGMLPDKQAREKMASYLTE